MGVKSVGQLYKAIITILKDGDYMVWLGEQVELIGGGGS